MKWIAGHGPQLRVLVGPAVRLFLGVLALALLSACRTMAPLPPVNTAEPGWTIRQGQAVWRAREKSPELAGELLLATHPDGRSFLQFTKTPLPFVVAQTTANSWQIQFVPENKTFSGPGLPPKRLLWLHLPRCIVGICADENLSFDNGADGSFHFTNLRSKESLTGFLAVVSLPKSYLVKSGDTLWAIARFYGITQENLRASNPALRSNSLRVGQILNLPPPLEQP